MIKINVGDYIETIDGEIGYVDKVDYIKDNALKFEVKLLNIENNVLVSCDDSFIKKYFKRIGSHDFTVKENKIEPIKIEPEYKEMTCLVANIKARDSSDTAIRLEPKMEKIICGIKEISSVELYNKINEIIDYINKEDK